MEKNILLPKTQTQPVNRIRMSLTKFKAANQQREVH